jgi:hypothetical protein
MKTQTKLLLLVLFFAMASCKKKISEPPLAGPLPELNNNEVRIAAITKEVAAVLEKVYSSNAAYNEVNAAINSGYYEDERVLLKDLLFPYSSELYKRGIFRKLKVDTGIFRKKFCEILAKGSYPLLNEELLTDGKRIKPGLLSDDARLPDANAPSVLSTTQPLAIYFPYSENFPGIKISDSFPPNSKMAIVKKATLVSTDRDADAGPGRAPYYCLGMTNNLCYYDVNVTDDYADGRPTHIITMGASIKEVKAAEVPASIAVTRIYHGSSRLTKQMDKLISLTGNGGGSEVKVCRINGYLKRSDEQITDFSGDVVTLNYTRGDVRKKKWKRVFSVWDPNWNYQDIEQIYAVYEDDNRGSRTFNGSVSTTIELPGKLGKVQGELGVRIEVMTQDEIITQRKLDRKSYLRDGLNNQGWGVLPDTDDFLAAGGDWPIFDGGTIWQYTLPYRIY